VLTKRLLSIVLSCTVMAAFGVFAGAAQAQTGSTFKVGAPLHATRTTQGFKSDSGKIAKSDPSLFHLSGSKLTPVVVKLDYDAIGSYRGYLPGYAATSPGTTHRSLKENKAAVGAYGRYIGKMEDRARSSLTRLVPQAKVVQSLRLAYGGFSALVPADQISKLLKVPGVVAVQRDRLNHLDAVQEPYQFIGADAVWPSIGGLPNAGSNVTIADLDTGIWPENPMLADNGTIPAPANGPYTCDFGDGANPAYGPDFTCNNKLVGARVDLTTYLSAIGAAPDEFCASAAGPCSARDSEGHGTHTATTAGGDFVDHAPIFGIDRGPTSGLAPGAHILVYRVCLAQGCFGSDSAAAVGQAIADGANVLNFSISGGKDPFSDPVELAFRDFYAAGGLASASAGNSGPGAATSDHAAPWENTVGASYASRLYLTTLHLTASNSDTADFTGSSITQPISSATPVVMAATVPGHASDATCTNAFSAGSVTGQIVACARGNPAGRAASSFAVMQGGAAGMVLYNPTHQDLFTDNFWVPTVMLDGGTTPQIPHDTTPFLAFMAGHTGVTATWVTGAATATSAGDVMTTFSSRGPLGDWIKPDITAPGIEILAGNSAEPSASEVASGPPGENFQAIAGTSMSAPHSTGVAALVFAAHPTWTPGQVKSAMMTSSVQDVMQPDGVTPADPFNDGAGAIRANRAVKPTVTFDESASDYAALASDPFGRIDANVPSIDSTTMPGSITTTRTMKNVSGVAQKFTVSTTATGGHISVSPSSFTLAPHGSKTITVTIHGESLTNGQQYFGTISLDANPGSNDVFIPVAWVKQAGTVTLTSSCAPGTIAKGAVTSCTTTVQNLSQNPSVTEVEEHYNPTGKLSHQNFTENHNAASTGSLSSGPTGYDWSGTLSPSIPPTVDSISNDESDPALAAGGGTGYLPLSALGVPAQSGFGDDTLTTFNVPSYRYGSEAYTKLGVSSNGYLVVGGQVVSADNNCCAPQHFPDTARPNNTLAPFWSDLNATPAVLGPGGGVYVATLNDGAPGDRWIVVDWEKIPVFGTSRLQNFEVWVRYAPQPVEFITYEYGDMTYPAAGNNANDPGQGAENRTGTSGQNIAGPIADNSSYSIHTSPPTPGGSVTVTYDVKGKKPGSYTLTTNMTSDQVAGTTVTKQPLTVT
jgi:subtilisin family serine protease